MRKTFFLICVFLISASCLISETAQRCRSGEILSFEAYKGEPPKDISTVFPELLTDGMSFVKLEILLDAGRQLSFYDYVLKNANGPENYRCVAVGESIPYDSANWKIGPYQEERKCSMIFLVHADKVVQKDGFVLVFALPIENKVADTALNLNQQNSIPAVSSRGNTSPDEKEEKKPEPNTLSKKDVADIDDFLRKNIKDVPKTDKTTNTQINLNEEFAAKISQIKVNEKSFTVYVLKDSGEKIKLCAYGIVPAENKDLHQGIEKALNEKYSGREVKVIPTGLDRYKRVTAKLYSNDEYLNRKMIDDGFAFYSPKYAPNDTELSQIKIGK
jgi:hypothetical protein